MDDKLKRLILYWKEQGVKLNSGISIEDITKMEAHFKFSFEEDFKTYMTNVNGFVDFDSDYAWFSFWSQDRIMQENNDNSHPDDIIWFSDYSINLCSFGFHKYDKKIYTHYQTIAGTEYIAETFNEFIDLYLKDPSLLLR